jgi:sarcosine oxidase
MVAVWEPRAGILLPELIIQSHLELAAKQGATLRLNEPVLAWEATRNGVSVSTSTGFYKAARLLIAAGAWTSLLLPDLRLPLTIERQVLFWFERQHSSQPYSNLFHPKTCPIQIWEYSQRRFFYAFPDLGVGIKAAIHHQGEPSSPDTLRRDVAPDEIESMRSLLNRFLPTAAGSLNSTAVCMYTNTPDEHFIIDFHPRYHQVVIASPCSGHGFKFSSAVGELAAQMLTEQTQKLDLSLFRISRFLKNDHERPV